MIFADAGPAPSAGVFSGGLREGRRGWPPLLRRLRPPIVCIGRLRWLWLGSHSLRRGGPTALRKYLEVTLMPGMPFRAGLVIAVLAFCSAPALAQDQIDRITGQVNPGGGPRAPEGVKVVAPGALVFARFDANFDGVITVTEIDAGAALAFTAADRNGDGQITGFEQTDWANAMGSTADVLSNAMTFDIDLDRSVTRAEFAAGLKRIAGQIRTEGDLTFADLLQPLSRLNQQADQGPGIGGGTLTGRGSPPRDGGGR
jgi:hypothetical protein